MRNSQPSLQGINPSSFKKHFERLFRTTPSQAKIYRPLSQTDIDRIYTQQLIKKSSGEPFPLCSDLSDFMVFGPGVYLLFRFLKLLMLIFAIIGILSMINVAILSSGSQIRDQKMKFSVFVAIMTVGNIQQSYNGAIPLLGWICLLVFTIGIAFWRQKEPQQVLDCSNARLLSSYFTVKLQTIPTGYSQSELKQFLQKHFGEVRQIFSVKKFNDDLFHYKQISQIIHQYKIQRCILNNSREARFKQEQGSQKSKSSDSIPPEVKEERSRQRLVQLFNEFYHYYLKVINWKKNKYQPVSAFITFQTVADKQCLLESYKPVPFWKKKNNQDQHLFKDQSLTFLPCEVEPDGISWQNISISAQHSCLRLSLQIILLFVVLVASLFIVYTLALAQNNITSLSTTQTVEEAKAVGTEDAIKQFCLSLSLSSFYNQVACHPHTGLFIKVILLELLLPLLIAVLKFLFAELMKQLVSVRRHPTQIAKLESQIFITFIFYFAVLGILQLLIDVEIATGDTGISINRFFHSFVAGIYDLLPVGSARPQTDFTRQWFINNSGKILLGALLSFNFSSLIDIIYSIGRKAILTRLAAHQETVAQMNDFLRCETLQIQFIYAFALNIVYFTLLFSAVMPILWIFAFISCTLLYGVQKLIFLRYCSQPLVFGHSVSHMVTRLVLFGVILSSAVTPFLLGGVILPGSSIGQRFLTFIYYPILGAVVLIYMFARKYWWSCVQSFRQMVVKQSNSDGRLPTVLSKMHQATNSLASYSMHSNTDYEPILRVLYTINTSQRHRQTFVINQKLQQFLSKNKDESEMSPFDELLFEIKNNSSTHNSKRGWFSRLTKYKHLLSIQNSLKSKKKGMKMPKGLKMDQIIEDIDSSMEQESMSDRKFTRSVQMKPKSFFNAQAKLNNSEQVPRIV